jgi:hypothetical protein
LQNLDLVAIGVGDEEEAGDHTAARGEIHQLARGKPGICEARVFGIDVSDGKGEVAIAIAQIVRLGPAFVDGEFQFEPGLCV